MTKTEFLNLLQQRLFVLNDEERIDLLNEYEQHIEMKIQSGLSEEDAIADFGNPDDLIRELLDAYHLNTDYPSENQTTSRIGYLIKSCAHFLTSTFESLCQMERKNLLQLLFRFIGIGIFLSALFVLGALFCSLLDAFLYSLPFGSYFSHFLYPLIELILYLLFLSFSIYLIIFFIRQYILVDYQPLKAPIFRTEKIHSTEMWEEIHQKEHFNHVKAYANHIANQTDKAFLRIKEKTVETQQNHRKKSKTKMSHKCLFPTISLTELCMKTMILCFRMIAFFFLLLTSCTTLGLIAATATGLVFVITGFRIIGLFLILVGSTLLAIVGTGLLAQFVFGIGGNKHETI